MALLSDTSWEKVHRFASGITVALFVLAFYQLIRKS